MLEAQLLLRALISILALALIGGAFVLFGTDGEVALDSESAAPIESALGVASPAQEELALEQQPALIASDTPVSSEPAEPQLSARPSDQAFDPEAYTVGELTRAWFEDQERFKWLWQGLYKSSSNTRLTQKLLDEYRLWTSKPQERDFRRARDNWCFDEYADKIESALAELCGRAIAKDMVATDRLEADLPQIADQLFHWIEWHIQMMERDRNHAFTSLPAEKLSEPAWAQGLPAEHENFSALFVTHLVFDNREPSVNMKLKKAVNALSAFLNSGGHPAGVEMLRSWLSADIHNTKEQHRIERVRAGLEIVVDLKLTELRSECLALVLKPHPAIESEAISALIATDPLCMGRIALERIDALSRKGGRENLEAINGYFEDIRWCVGKSRDFGSALALARDTLALNERLQASGLSGVRNGNWIFGGSFKHHPFEDQLGRFRLEQFRLLKNALFEGVCKSLPENDKVTAAECREYVLNHPMAFEPGSEFSMVLDGWWLSLPKTQRYDAIRDFYARMRAKRPASADPAKLEFLILFLAYHDWGTRVRCCDAPRGKRNEAKLWIVELCRHVLEYLRDERVDDQISTNERASQVLYVIKRVRSSAVQSLVPLVESELAHVDPSNTKLKDTLERLLEEIRPR